MTPNTENLAVIVKYKQNYDNKFDIKTCDSGSDDYLLAWKSNSVKTNC